MKIKIITLFVLFNYTLIFATAVDNSFYNNSKYGWFYYKKDLKKKKEKKKMIKEKELTTLERIKIPFENNEERKERKKLEKSYINNLPYDELDELSADEYRRMLDTTREISVATPKKNYVKAYATLQKFWMDKSEKYAKVWKVANLENPDELIYDKFESSLTGRKYRGQLETKERAKFFNGLKKRLGYIIIVENINNTNEIKQIKLIYDSLKKEFKINYKIVDFYDVHKLARKLKIKKENLPDHYFMYQGNKNREIFKRVSKGYPSRDKVLKNTEFIYKNVLFEKNKNKLDK